MYLDMYYYIIVKCIEDKIIKNDLSYFLEKNVYYLLKQIIIYAKYRLHLDFQSTTKNKYIFAILKTN